MPISVRCTCGAKIKAKDDMAGKTVACPKCKQPLAIVPLESTEDTTDALATEHDASDDMGSLPSGDLGEDAGSLPDDLPLDDLSSPQDELLSPLDDLPLDDLSSSQDDPPSPLDDLTQDDLSPQDELPSATDATGGQQAKGNRTVLIAAIAGGGALVLLLVGGLIAWMVFSGGSEVAENTTTADSQASPPGDQSSGHDEQSAKDQQAAKEEQSPQNKMSPQGKASITPGPTNGKPDAATSKTTPGTPKRPPVDPASTDSVPDSAPTVPQVKTTAAPEQPIEDTWVVLSNLRSEPSARGHKLSIDWKLVQGYVLPGKSYQLFVFSKVFLKPGLGSVHSMDVDLYEYEGTFEIEIPTQSANGPLRFSSAVVGEKEGRGYKLLVSGELNEDGMTSAAKPPGTEPEPDTESEKVDPKDAVASKTEQSPNESTSDGPAGTDSSSSSSTLRTWQDATGNFSIEAEFAGHESGQVRLKKADGSEISVPLEQLSDEDQEWVRNRGRQPATRIYVHDGIAFCAFVKSGGQYKVGTVDGDQVTLYATYGGVTLALKRLEEAVATIAEGDAEGPRQEPRALANALFSQQLLGIWIVESISFDGMAQSVRDDDPSYLILRADKTFRIVKKGRKPSGTWELDSEGRLVMNATNDESQTAEIRRQPGDKLEMLMEDDGSMVKVQYGRTDLTEEPKAVDEQ